MAKYQSLLFETMMMSANCKPIVVEIGSDFEAPPPALEKMKLPDDFNMEPAENNACWTWTHTANKPNVVTDVGCRVRGMGMNYEHVMSVCHQIKLERVSAFLPGRQIDLPLTMDFVMEKFRIEDGHNPASTSGLWQLEAKLDQSLLVVFGYKVGAGGVEALSKAEATKLGDNLVPGGNSPKTKVDAAVGEALKLGLGPLRILVFFSVTFCKERPDFEPGGILGINRLYPHALIVASQDLESVEASFVIIRSAIAAHAGAMPDPAPPPTDLSLPPAIKPIDSMLSNIKPVMFADSNITKSIPSPFWDDVFDYYEVEPIKNGVGTSIPMKFVDPLRTDLRGKLLARRGIEGKLTQVSKLPRQGEFDNVHISPPMAMGPPPLAAGLKTDSISMAPFCVHDCLHMHTRWGLIGDHPSGSTRGFNASGVPYRSPGSPLVPHNQTVSITLLSPPGEIGYRYAVEAKKPSAGSFTVCFHHGIGYANDLWGLVGHTAARGARVEAESFAIKSGEHMFASRTAANSWATFYWRLRFGGVPGTPVERLIVSDLSAARAL